MIRPDPLSSIRPMTVAADTPAFFSSFTSCCCVLFGTPDRTHAPASGRWPGHHRRVQPAAPIANASPLAPAQIVQMVVSASVDGVVRPVGCEEVGRGISTGRRRWLENGRRGVDARRLGHFGAKTTNGARISPKWSSTSSNGWLRRWSATRFMDDGISPTSARCTVYWIHWRTSRSSRACQRGAPMAFESSL